jgi:hypothetical protein
VEPGAADADDDAQRGAAALGAKLFEDGRQHIA